MDEQNAWNQFISTGSVADYLKYSALKGNFENSKGEIGKGDANQDERNNNQRASYF